MRSGAESRTPSALGAPSGPAIGGRKGVGSRIEPKPGRTKLDEKAEEAAAPLSVSVNSMPYE